MFVTFFSKIRIFLKCSVKILQSQTHSALQERVNIFAVGISKDVDVKELAAISSPPHRVRENFWVTPGFDTLYTLIGILYESICKVTSTVVSTPRKYVQKLCMLHQRMETYNEHELNPSHMFFARHVKPGALCTL